MSEAEKIADYERQIDARLLIIKVDGEGNLEFDTDGGGFAVWEMLGIAESLKDWALTDDSDEDSGVS